MLTAALLALGTLQAALAAAAPSEPPAKAPARQIVAIYFHRTVRCPTCKRIGALAEEAVLKGFPKEVKARAVVFQFVDFQDKKNAAVAKAYKVEGPVLVLSEVREGKVVRWQALPKVWQMVAKPQELVAYVRASVAARLAPPKDEAEPKS